VRRLEHRKGDIAIKCENVTVGYGRNIVLRDVSLNIPRGSFIPFLGPNGAGKTTLVRTILGLLEPVAGRIHTRFKVNPPGYVPQQGKIDPLYPVTVRQIISMGFYPVLGWWGRQKEKQKEFLKKILKEFDLLDHAGRDYSELSSGMKQKVLIARAFASGAECFIMDEPAAQLDEQSELELIQRLFHLSRHKGKTVIFVHHGFDLISEMIDAVCHVEHGCASIISRDEHFSRRRYAGKNTRLEKGGEAHG